MNKKLVFTFVLFVFISSLSFAQKTTVALKDGKVIVNGLIEAFKFHKSDDSQEFKLLSADKKKVIAKMTKDKNGTPKIEEDDAKILHFTKQNITIKSKALGQKKWRKVIKLLFKEHVLKANGNVSKDHLKKFAEKYGDKGKKKMPEKPGVGM